LNRPRERAFKQLKFPRPQCVNITVPSKLQDIHSSQLPSAFTLEFCMICHFTRECRIIYLPCPYLFKHFNNNAYMYF